jgi:HAD superfamily hydrolase (TIGR01662 family)
MAGRWVSLDVGETLIDETRVWSTWADILGVPRFTFMATLGAAIARGEDHRAVFDIVERPEWRSHSAEFNAAYAGFQATDLYPDALPALAGLRAAGYRLAVLANQPAQRTAELRALGITVDVMAMSEEVGAYKPAADFYARALAMMDAHAADVAYVGDRLDNDVVPAAAAGMHAVWLRRGPWALAAGEVAPHGTLVVDSLTELVERVGECWSSG